MEKINKLTGFFAPGSSPGRSVFMCVCLVMSYPLNATEHQALVEDREIELEVLRNQIRDVRSSIAEARNNAESYMGELQKNEKSILEFSIKLETIEDQIKNQLSTLENLQIERIEQEQVLSQERELLADQVRVAYKTGRHDFLKLLLNQENPEMIGRMMTYHDYYNRARTNRISEIQITLNNISQLEKTIDNETRKMEILRDEQLDRIEQLASYRDERQEIISELNAYIADQDRELQTLQADEQELSILINELKNKQDIVYLYENLTPFESLRGKLSWPVRGNIITTFGSAKREGKLRWNGVKISSRQGNDVNAVSAGKVIFADWFRNLGLLIIIDHGNGYMSLYGHNERLLKKAGDFVSTDEAIAKVGNTGGQSETALYFEIRQQGTPMNPGLWCKR